MGSLSSIVMGGSMPVYAILFAEVLGVLSKDADTARSESVFWSLMFLVTGVVVGLAMFFQVTFEFIKQNNTLKPAPSCVLELRRM